MNLIDLTDYEAACAQIEADAGATAAQVYALRDAARDASRSSRNALQSAREHGEFASSQWRESLIDRESRGAAAGWQRADREIAYYGPRVERWARLDARLTDLAQRLERRERGITYL